MSDSSDNFERVVMPYLESVYRAAFALSGRRDRAEDLTQTVLLKAFEQFGSFKKGTNCKAWLLRILRNTWIDQLRHQKVVGNTTPVEENLIAAPPQETAVTFTDEKDLLENFSDEQVIAALKTLPEEQRFALFLVDVEQLSHEEAARVLQVPVGTVKSRTSRARANLKVQLFSHAKALGFNGGER